MPLAPPPSRGDITPVIKELPAYTRLWRLHRRMIPNCAFDPFQPDRLYSGGRFDPTPEDPYPYLYAGLSPQVTLTESLLRPVPPDERGYRLLPRASITDRHLSAVDTTVRLKLISLVTGHDLGAVAQDAWLITTGASDYAATRRWARYLRAAAPDAQGLIWQPVRSTGDDGRAVILFGDRLDRSAIQSGSITIALDTAEGAERLNEYLEPWRAYLVLPESPWSAEQAPDTTEPTAEADGAVLADFDDFYKSSFRKIRRIVYAMTLDMDLATEATDDAFLSALRKWEHVAGMENPVGYVVRIACNIARRVLRKLAAQGFAMSLDAHPEIQPRSNTTASPDTLASRDALEQALRAIPAAQSECFLLHHLCGYTVREIAAHQEVPEGTVKSRLHSARTALRELLGEDFTEGGLQ